MTFPVMFFTDLPIWYNIVANILIIVGVLIALVYIMFTDDIDDFNDIATFVAIVFIVIPFIAIAWGIILILGIIFGILMGIVLGLRYIRVKAFDWHYYRQEM